jgi:glycosyltransferase involved in cell wall biosynthesis
MRILVVHNRYRSSMPSGENRVVDDEVEMLRDAGLVVETFFRDSDDIESFGPLRKAALAVSPTYSAEAVRDFRRVLAEFRPDVVHLHNPFPLISPWVVRVAKQAGIPVVQTVHNYRMSCPAGTFFRDGKICEDCTGKAFPWPAVQHGCYRGSRAQSLSIAVAARAHRSTWELVDRFLPVSEFVADKLIEAGVPRTRITVKYNACAVPARRTPPGNGFLLASRLGAEKGIRLMLDAWDSAGLRGRSSLTIAGDGPLRPIVEAASRVDDSIRYVGRVPPFEVERLLQTAAVAIIPSTWYEGLPTIAVQAFAVGRPVITTDVGALASSSAKAACWITPLDAAALAKSLVEAAGDRLVVERKARLALECHRSKFTPKAVRNALIGVYTTAASGQRSTKR